MGTFGEEERRITALFKNGTKFCFQEKQYKTVWVGKPTCQGGEPKTDIYILARSLNDEMEIKISYKKENADFLENKMSAERAEQLFGQNWMNVIADSTSAIRDKFEE